MLVVATVAFGSPRSAGAQHSTTAQRDGWIVGPLVGLPGFGSEAIYPLATLGVGVTRLVPNRVGVDFAIGTAPYALAEGIVPIAARIGPSIPMEIAPDAFLIPSAGFSGILIASPYGGGGVPGWYAGAATVVAHGSVGFRAGVTVHGPFDRSAAAIWLAEIGVMHVPLPRLAH